MKWLRRSVNTFPSLLLVLWGTLVTLPTSKISTLYFLDCFSPNFLWAKYNLFWPSKKTFEGPTPQILDLSATFWFLVDVSASRNFCEIWKIFQKMKIFFQNFCYLSSLQSFVCKTKKLFSTTLQCNRVYNVIHIRYQLHFMYIYILKLWYEHTIMMFIYYIRLLRNLKRAHLCLNREVQYRNVAKIQYFCQMLEENKKTSLSLLFFVFMFRGVV